MPVFLVKHVFPGGPVLTNSYRYFVKFHFLSISTKHMFFPVLMKFDFSYVPWGLHAKYFFDQLFLISLLFNELTCLSCMTLSSDCISTNFDYCDSRNDKNKKKNMTVKHI